MNRVLVIGNAGAGKSTLAAKLGSILDLPVIHLDQHFWQPGWVETEQVAWRDKVHQLVSGERWIIDGNYDRTLDLRLPRADTVIYLDFPTRICLWQIAKRIISGYGRTRPDLAPGCPEKIDLEFLHWAWRFRRDVRPRVYAGIEEYYQGGKLIILTTPAEVSAFLSSMEDVLPRSG
jgi:adenylate kinase family enzyme